ncbi:VanZ family protein [Clostridium sp. B9]|uniref:VanZ family protein n=1 Tax=Clostridium sp. B9 TaxID=3423224 RepID=UPI003D2ED33F
MGLLVSLFIGSIIYSIILIKYFKKENIKYSKLFVGGLFIFVLYLFLVIDITGPGHILSMGVERERVISLVPFKFQDNMFGMIANAILFIPLGVFLPSLWSKFERCLNTFLVGFFLSLAIELLQLLNMRATDIDDLIMNTLGTVIGFFIYKLLFKKVSKRFEVNSSSNKLWVKYNGEIFIILMLGLSFFIAPFVDNLLIKIIFGI